MENQQRLLVKYQGESSREGLILEKDGKKMEKSVRNCYHRKHAGIYMSIYLYLSNSKVSTANWLITFYAIKPTFQIKKWNLILNESE